MARPHPEAKSQYKVFQSHSAVDFVLRIEELEQQSFLFPLQQSGELLLALFRPGL